MDMKAHFGEANRDDGDIMSLALLIHFLRLVPWTDQNEAEIKSRRLLERYKGDVHDWGSHFQEGYDFYDRKLLLQIEKFTLLLLVFPPRKGNKVHDHGSSSCVFKVLQGELFERQYNKPRGGQERLLRKGQITYRQGELNTSSATNTLHCVRNLSRRETAVSLVLYYPALTECHIYTNSGHAYVTQPMFGRAVPTVHDLHRLDGDNDDDAEEIEDHEL